MNYIQNVWKLYAIRFFHNLIPAYVIERLFWEQRVHDNPDGNIHRDYICSNCSFT